jgi:hypothetical protein
MDGVKRWREYSGVAAAEGGDSFAEFVELAEFGFGVGIGGGEGMGESGETDGDPIGEALGHGAGFRRRTK